MRFSVVYSLIDNDTLHHSGQNLLRTHSAATRESTTFWPLWWRVSLSIKLYTTLNNIRFVFYHNIKGGNLCLDNWTHRLGFESARAALCKWAPCTRQTLSKTFANKDFKKQTCRQQNDHFIYSTPALFVLFFSIIACSVLMALIFYHLITNNNNQKSEQREFRKCVISAIRWQKALSYFPSKQ